jgi:hypothetical protein
MGMIAGMSPGDFTIVLNFGLSGAAENHAARFKQVKFKISSINIAQVTWQKDVAIPIGASQSRMAR